MSLTGWVKSLLEGGPGPKSGAKNTSGGRKNSSSEKDAAVEVPVVDHTVLEQWAEGLVIYGEFEIKRVLGKGALGAVYLVSSVQDERRFVVKRVKFASESKRRTCQERLKDWLYLPEHPHLTSCRFVRTAKDEADIFIEFVPGTSLRALMNSKELYAGEAPQPLARILDIAIQSAWGLRALHELKLLHENLKPDNILIGAKDHLRITDVRLDRATTHAKVPGGGKASGISPYYQSPETSAGGEATRASELWNWGAIVMEMFLGTAEWSEYSPKPGGEQAPSILGDLERRGPQALAALKRLEGAPTMEGGPPPLPKEVAKVLEKCFQPAPAARWSSLDEVTGPLKQLFAAQTGEPYPRRMPALLNRGNQLGIAHARWLKAGGAQWSRPVEWHNKARRALGEPLQPESQNLTAQLNRNAQATQDLDAYEAARKAFEKALNSGHQEMRHELANLCVDNAFLHVSVDDLPSALAKLEQAIGIWEKLVREEDHWELGNDLAMTYLHKATALKNLGQFQPALEFFDKAISTWQDLVKERGWLHLGGNLGWAQAMRAEVLLSLSEQAGQRAGEMARQAAALKERAEFLAEEEKTQARARAEAERVRAEEERAAKNFPGTESGAAASGAPPAPGPGPQTEGTSQTADAAQAAAGPTATQAAQPGTAASAPASEAKAALPETPPEGKAEGKESGQPKGNGKKAEGPKDAKATALKQGPATEKTPPAGSGKEKAGQNKAKQEAEPEEAEEAPPPPPKADEVLALGEQLKTGAETEAASAKALGTQSDREGKQALALLKAEVKRTDRDDVRAILHWAEKRLQA